MNLNFPLLNYTISAAAGRSFNWIRDIHFTHPLGASGIQICSRQSCERSGAVGQYGRVP